MKYEIQLEKPALKQLSKFDKPIREKLIAAIEGLAFDPRPNGYKKLVDQDGT